MQNLQEQIQKIRQETKIEISRMRMKEKGDNRAFFMYECLNKSDVGLYCCPALGAYSSPIEIQLFENGMIILGTDEYPTPSFSIPGQKYNKIIAVYSGDGKLLRVRKQPYEIMDSDGRYRFLKDFEVLSSGEYYKFFKSSESEIAKFRNQPTVKREFVRVKAEARIRRLKRRGTEEREKGKIRERIEELRQEIQRLESEL